MGRSKWDYPYYGTRFLAKEDLKPAILSRYGIKATQKQIDSVYKQAYHGWILTGAFVDGRCRHTYVYSIKKLKEALELVYGS